jgi:hypothetical protein
MLLCYPVIIAEDRCSFGRIYSHTCSVHSCSADYLIDPGYVQETAVAAIAERYGIATETLS